MAGDDQKSIAAGMNDPVTKPKDLEHLFATLQKWIKPAAERGSGPLVPMLDTPAESDPVESAEDELPKTLPGFDLTAGLERLMGNKRLFRKLLLDFGTEYDGVAADIHKALAFTDPKIKPA